MRALVPAALLFVVSCGVRMPFMAATTDDAFITYRYVESIVGGAGFVYNPGERVLGVTTPLYTLLLSLLALLGLSPLSAGPWLNVIADSLVAPILARRCAGAGAAPAATGWRFGPVLYALSPINAFWSASGMETGLFCCATALALFYYERSKYNASAIACAVAFLLRVDAAILIVVLLVHFAVARRRVPWKPLAVFLAAAGPWLVFATLYFGHPVPNSVLAKAALPKTGIADAALYVLAMGFLHAGDALGIVMLLSAVYAVLFDERARWSAWTVYAIAYMAAYTLSLSQLHPWYYPPAYVGYAVAAGAGLDLACDRLRPGRWRRPVTAAMAVLLALNLVVTLREKLRDQVALGTYLRSTGIAVREIAPAGSTLFLKDIGYLGYYSQLHIHDFAGLVTPGLTAFRAKEDFLGALRQVRSDYALLASDLAASLDRDPWFRTQYRVVCVFRGGAYRMVLYGRRDPL
ncbi:MAG: hypothetical protein AB1714_19770 [Acidobacteriota bacterium]